MHHGRLADAIVIRVQGDKLDQAGPPFGCEMDRETPWNPRTFHLAQILTGHMAFGEYLHHFDLLDSPEYYHYGAKVDDAEHSILLASLGTNACRDYKAIWAPNSARRC